jgi:hypothetical protein
LVYNQRADRHSCLVAKAVSNRGRTKAVVQATPEGILLKPVTSVTIRRLRGILKRKPGDKPFDQEWAEHKSEEKELEESKYARTASSR